MKTKNQAGAVAGVSTLISLGVVLVVYGIVTSFGADIVGDIQDDFVENSTQYDIAGDALDGISTTSEKLPTISSVAVAAIIIGIILSAFGGVAMARM
jgi:hypothetical protein